MIVGMNILAKGDSEWIGIAIFIVVTLVSLIGKVIEKSAGKKEQAEQDRRAAEDRQRRLRLQQGKPMQPKRAKVSPYENPHTPTRPTPVPPRPVIQPTPIPIAQAAPILVRPPPPPQPIEAEAPTRSLLAEMPETSRRVSLAQVDTAIDKLRAKLNTLETARRRALGEPLTPQAPHRDEHAGGVAADELDFSDSQAVRRGILYAEILGRPKALREGREIWEQ